MWVHSKSIILFIFMSDIFVYFYIYLNDVVIICHFIWIISIFKCSIFKKEWKKGFNMTKLSRVCVKIPCRWLYNVEYPQCVAPDEIKKIVSGLFCYWRQIKHMDNNKKKVCHNSFNKVIWLEKVTLLLVGLHFSLLTM